MSIPLIDLTAPENDICNLLEEASTTSGFFVLKNHGMPKSLRNNVLRNCQRFFDLPEPEKMKQKSEIVYTGYQPYGKIKVDKEHGEAKGDLREGHYACRGVPWVDAKAGDPWPEQWPSEAELPGFASVNKQFAEACLLLTRQLLRLLSLTLKQKEGCLEEMLQDPFVALHNLHYAPVVSEPEKGIVGLGAHSDFGLLTLLVTEQPGLQISLEDGWTDLHTEPDSIIVNLGDELQRCTNDAFKSMRHRVVSNGRDRYSVAFFVNADYDCTLQCLPDCCSAERPAQYAPISSSDFMLQKFNQAHST